ncbi:Serine/threonine-protein kinase Nek2 [Saguinus oedipus]|uniref:non-specific serine/threonine protein kinase n=1 Tax=Saguinus oedipus TaxID=9490 RepID=A0ABQ9TPB8_SAGOE|nr:Serine/threonine-protein kinase Nek2 [Saguinus oedipus]
MPSRVEDYEVLYTIGTGSYGRCQKIRRKNDGKVSILVWKELDYGSMTEAEKQMLVSEVNLLRELKHPNIVRYYDRIIDRTNTTLYIVMEYCEGGDLASVITKGTKERQYLDEEFILRVMTQLTLALKECHRRSDGGHTVLHRDLKPANVFLDGKQNEQMNRMSYNEKSDIWSLGCLLYELCALMPPFTAFNQKELAGKIREGKFRRIPYRYSDELNDIITRMLNLKDYHRPSVEEILENPLIADLVAEEQRRNLERRGRQLGEPEKLQDSSPVLSELKLKEIQLQERERALRAREERLELKEQELCVRERLAEDKLARAENLLKNYSLLKEEKFLFLTSNPGMRSNSDTQKIKQEYSPSFLSQNEWRPEIRCLWVLTEDEMGHPETGDAITWLKEILEYNAIGGIVPIRRTGQTLELITVPHSNADLGRFTEKRYKSIVKYKTAFYSFYLPVAAAMHMAGIDGEKAHTNAKILLEMGEFLQIQDDHLDLFGDPSVTSKVGTDFQDNRCSWPVVQCLQQAIPEQHQVLKENYGQKEAKRVAWVKALYRELDLLAVFLWYEEDS